MLISFPTNTIILIVAAMFATGASAWFILSRGLRQLSLPKPVGQRWRWGIGVFLAVWLLARLALAMALPGSGSVTLITFSSLAMGMLTGILAFSASPLFRQIIRATPATWLVGAHSIRIAGFLFLALEDMRLLPAQFALPAGYGDISVGLLALLTISLLAKDKPHARAWAIAWNLFGLLDLVTALATGLAFIGPFSRQLAGTGTSLAYLNYVLLVPSFAVPLFALLHVYSLFQLLTGGAGETGRDLEAPNQAMIFSEEGYSIRV